MIVKGVLYRKLEFKKFEKFNKWTIVLKEDKNYFKIEALGYLSERVEQMKEGDDILVEFTVGGNLWKDKEGKEVFFTSLRAKSIELSNNENQTKIQVEDSEEDDLPF